MYWWNVSQLAEALREGRVDEKERFKYYVATFIFWNMAAQGLFHFGGTFRIEDLISISANLIFILIGMTLCYQANKSGDNTDFIGRMICLGWPIGIRLAVIFSALLLASIVALSLGEAAIGHSFLSSLSFQVLALMHPLYWLCFIVPYYSTICWNLVVVVRGKSAADAILKRKTDWSPGKVGIGILGGIGIVILTVSLFVWIHDAVANVILAELFSIYSILVPLGLISFWWQFRQILNHV